MYKYEINDKFSFKVGSQCSGRLSDRKRVVESANAELNRILRRFESSAAHKLTHNIVR